MTSQWQTRQSLIQRAQNPSDEEAWSEFVHYYKNFIYFILNHMNIPASDIDDFVQEILVHLWKRLKSYEIGKAKFRNWLSTVIRNTALNYIKKKSTASRHQQDSLEALKELHRVSEPEMDRIIEIEWKAYIAHLTMNRLEQMFTPGVLNVFKLSLKGVNGEDIAAQTGLALSTVYTFRTRVKKVFIREMKQLIEELEF